MSTSPRRIVTLIITRATLPTGWQEALRSRLDASWQTRIFFLYQGVHQVGDAIWSEWIGPDGQASFCAQGHARIKGPNPAAGIQPGGLATLGQMLRASDLLLSLPVLYWPGHPAASPLKRIAILLNGPDEAISESLRIGAGLAGCDHRITLYAPAPTPVPDAARPCHEALEAMGAEWVFGPVDPEQLARNCDGIIHL
ncbi:MAG: hypothetical protein HQL91_00855 [Magnetococcales bacterium]|nr:hypothetical protein [Magnetococcales bacterium]